MKKTLKTKPITNRSKRLLLGLGLAAAVLFHHHQALAGTDILHFLSKTAMTNTGVDLDASGKVDANLNRQGNAYNQQLKITVAKLEPNAVYQLVAFLGDDTNATSVAQFTTDANGAFKIAFMKKAQGNQSSKVEPLPAVLDPLCNVRELSIQNGSTQAVLRAGLTNPQKGQYMVKRSMTNPGFLPGAAGDLRLKTNFKSATQFRLQASHLTPSTDYVLLLNGNAAQTNTSDLKGKLMLKALPANAPSVLDIETVELTDATGTNVVLISGGLGLPCSTSAQAALPLATAANFAVLAGSTVTSTGNTVVTGDVGVWAGTGVTGFAAIAPGGPGIVNGTIHAGDATAQIAQGDLTLAYNDAAGRTLAPIDVANADLGGLTLAPGLYKSSGTLAITGTLTLDAKGDANGVFIFQVASSLDTATGSQVVLAGGAKAANIYWQVGSSATLATTTVFKGTIMADQSITLANGATLEGRALARIGAVAMDANVITIPVP
jgi:hypothetical protein